jgi:hypothetical protein
MLEETHAYCSRSIWLQLCQCKMTRERVEPSKTTEKSAGLFQFFLTAKRLPFDNQKSTKLYCFQSFPGMEQHSINKFLQLL